MYVCMCECIRGIRKIHNKLISGFSISELFKILNYTIDKDKMFLFETLSPYFFPLKSQTPGTIQSRF